MSVSNCVWAPSPQRSTTDNRLHSESDWGKRFFHGISTFQPSGIQRRAAGSGFPRNPFCSPPLSRRIIILLVSPLISGARVHSLQSCPFNSTNQKQTLHPAQMEKPILGYWQNPTQISHRVPCLEIPNPINKPMLGPLLFHNTKPETTSGQGWD